MKQDILCLFGKSTNDVSVKLLWSIFGLSVVALCVKVGNADVTDPKGTLSPDFSVKQTTAILHKLWNHAVHNLTYTKLQLAY